METLTLVLQELGALHQPFGHARLQQVIKDLTAALALLDEVHALEQREVLRKSRRRDLQGLAQAGNIALASP